MERWKISAFPDKISGNEHLTGEIGLLPVKENTETQSAHRKIIFLGLLGQRQAIF